MANRDLNLSVRVSADPRQGIEAFRVLKRGVLDTRSAFEDATARVASLAKQLQETEKPSAALNKQFAAAQREAAALKGELQAQERALNQSRQALTAAGVDVKNLAAEYRRLKAEAAEAARAGAETAQAQVQAARVTATEQEKAARWAAVARSKAEREVRAEAEATKLAQIAAAKRAAAEQEKAARWAAVARARAEREAQAEAAKQARSARLDEVGRAVSGNAGGAFSALGVRSNADIQREITAVEQALQRLAGEANISGAEFDRAFATGTRRVTELRREMAGAVDPFTTGVGRANAGLDALGTRLKPLAAAVGAAFAVDRLAAWATDLGATADLFSNLNARIGLLNAAQAGWNVTLQDTADIALATYSSLEGTVQLAFSLARAGKSLGVSQAETLALTSTINKANQLAGQSAAATDAALVQLIQGLQSGQLRGEEFNSVMEQSPRLAQALADGLGKPIESLRQLAEDGQLTSSVVIAALQSQAAAIDKEFAALPLTIGRSIAQLQTRWTMLIGSLDASSGASATVARGIQAIAENLDELAAVAGRAGAVLLAAFAIQAAKAFRTYVAEATLATRATNLLSLSISKLPRVVNITVALVGFETAYQVGDWLQKNFAIARELGVAIVGFFQLVLNDLQLVMEATAAVFNDDTVAGAFGRYIERNRSIGQTLAEMFDDAEKGPIAVADATRDAASAQGALGSAATQAGRQVALGMGSASESVQKVGDEAKAALAALAQIGQVKLTGGDLGGDLAAGIASSPTAGANIAAALKEQVAELDGAELARFSDDFVQQLRVAANEALIEFERIRKAGGATAQQLKDAWAEYLRLRNAAGAGARDVASRAAEQLGVDLDKFSGGLSKSFRDAQENFSVLIRQFPQLKAEGVDTAAVVQAALAGMTDKAKTKADLDALLNRIQALGKDGKLSGSAMVTALEAVRTKAKEAASDGVESLRESLKNATEQAAKLRAEANELSTKASQALSDRNQQAQDRRDRNLTPEEQDATSSRRARDAIDEANRQATFANSAAISGRAKDAERYAQTALDLANRAAAEANKIGDNDLAAKLLEQIGEAEQAAIGAQQRAAEKAAAVAEETQKARAAELAAATQQQQADLTALEARIQSIAAGAKVKVTADSAEALTAITGVQASLDALPAEKVITIRTVTATGVEIGDGTGLSDLPGRAYGGPLPGRALHDRSDNMLYRGTPGEWVIQRPAVRFWGSSVMRAINEMRLPQFAYGGMLGEARRSAVSEMAGQGDMVGANLVFPGEGSYRVQATADVHAEMGRLVRRLALKKGRRK